MLRRAFLIALLVSGFALPAFAAPSEDVAKALVNNMAGDVISTLSAPNRTDAQIAEKFHALLKQNFNIDDISRFVLGRFWRSASDTQKTEYQKLFEDYIVGIYANRFKNYSGETVKVTGARSDSGHVIVASTINLTNGAKPVLVEWKIGDGPENRPMVEDVIIEQVSMSLTQRSEFSTIIQNGGGNIETLLGQLRAKVGRH